MDRISDLLSYIPLERFSILIKTGPNLFYLTGFEGEGYLYLDPYDRILFTDGRYIEEAEEVKGVEIERLDKRKLDFFLSLYKGGPVFIEYDRASCREFMELQRLPLSGNISDIGWALSDMRSRKSPEEMELIKEAVRLSEEVIFYVLDNYMREGVSEADLASEFIYQVKRKGASLSFEPLFLFGENTSKPHGKPSPRRLKRGDVVLLDFGVRYRGYCSDETITFYFGEPTSEFLDFFYWVKEAQGRAVASINENPSPKEAGTIVKAFFTSKGVGDLFLHALGHGVGVEVHEAPVLSDLSRDKLEKGSVFTLEPGLYRKGEFGVRLEDMFYLSNNGISKITTIPKEPSYDDTMSRMTLGG